MGDTGERTPETMRARHGTRAGFSLVELMLGMVVMIVAVLGATGSITSSAILGESTREVLRANVAAREMAEELLSMPCAEAFATYNDFMDDDPDGVGTADGSGFGVFGLGIRPTDPDGMVGRVLFPVSPLSPGVLREDRVDVTFGMPMDLNADGELDAEDHAADCRVLPAKVRLEWTGPSGDRFLEIDLVLGDR